MRWTPGRWPVTAPKATSWWPGQPPAPEVRILRALIARLDAVTQDLQREKNRQEKAEAIDDHYDPYPPLKRDRDRLKTISGVGNASAHRMLCLLKRRRFTSARQAAACAGLVPVRFESGTSVHKRPHLSKQGDPRLRATLYMAAVVATRYNPPLRRVYQDLIARGKTKMSALGALMRRLIHIAFGILKHQMPFNPALVSQRA